MSQMPEKIKQNKKRRITLPNEAIRKTNRKTTRMNAIRRRESNEKNSTAAAAECCVFCE